MINQLTVIQSTGGSAGTIQANGLDAFVDNRGLFNVSGVGSIPAPSVMDVVRIPSSVEQVKKQVIMITSANNTSHTMVINGFALSSGMPTQKIINWTESSASSVTLSTTQCFNAIAALTDFNVTATLTSAANGQITLSGTAGTAACPKAQYFTLGESDIYITPVAVPTVSFTAAPSGGRTAAGYAIIADAGTVSSIVITDGGEGYVSPPTATVNGFSVSGATVSANTSGSATTVIFEGEVVSQLAVTAGSGYLGREGYQVVGTPAALQAKYNYVASTPNAPGAPAYPALANLVSGYTYTEWIVTYVVPNGAGNSFSQTSTIGQMSILVYESATNVAALNSAWGTLNNLRKGYKASFIASGTCAVVIPTTGIITFSIASPASLGLKGGDLLIVGTGAFPNTATSGALVLGSVSSDTVGLCVPPVTGITPAVVFTGVKRAPISR